MTRKEDKAGEAPIDVMVRDGWLVVTPLMTEITYRNSREFLNQVKNAADEEACGVVLNMKNVDLIDSVSLGTLVAIKKYVKAHGSDVRVANLSNLIMELFKLLNFPSVFEIYESVDDAISGGKTAGFDGE